MSVIVLTSKDGNTVSTVLVMVYTINFNDGHVVIIYGEDIVWITANIHQTETVARNRIFSAA